jgi:hypothetical protein
MGVAEDVLSLDPDPRDLLGGLLVPPSLDSLGGAERIFAEFVYLEGFALAVEAYVAGGWAGLEQAMAQRRTTSQMLHPERAAPREPQLGPDEPGAEGLVLVDTDSLGEQGIFALVSVLTGKDNLGLQAGDGWEGDRLFRWERPDGERSGEGVTLWLSVWRDEEQAADFVYAVGRALQARFPEASIEPGAPEGQSFEAGERRFRLERRGLQARLRVAAAGLEEAPQALPETKTD